MKATADRMLGVNEARQLCWLLEYELDQNGNKVRVQKFVYGSSVRDAVGRFCQNLRGQLLKNGNFTEWGAVGSER